ncbi:MAG TPA: YraN family protein [Thermoanaerobacterales bacterium]|nr:YraN family protein [Thermoanaerobacterales bacterium]
MLSNIEKGKKGEELCACYLKREKYNILERNYRCPLGEIDIIALYKGVYIFVEVKTRTSIEFGLPLEAVNKKKQKKIRDIALFYLKSKNINNFNCRFDVLSVILKGNKYEINHIKNAF